MVVAAKISPVAHANAIVLTRSVSMVRSNLCLAAVHGWKAGCVAVHSVKISSFLATIRF